MRRLVLACASALALIFLLIISSAAQTKTKINPKLSRQATITLDAARQTALAAAPGNVLEEELEKEHGKLVYSFDIQRTGGAITEVQVDAKAGTIVSTEEESAATEAKEKREDTKRNRTKKPGSR